MRIADILSDALIVPELAATNKVAVIEEIVEHVTTVRPEIDKDDAVRVLLKRETLGSTGVGRGLAIPHAKLACLDTVIACLARSPAGVPFESLDGEPVHLVLALFAPTGRAPRYLEALARASRLFHGQAFRERLMAAPDRHALWEIVLAEDARLTEQSERPR